MPTHLHLSAALNDATASYRSTAARAGALRRPEAHWTRLIRLAEQGGLDFVTLDVADHELDALAVLARAAGTTTSIGLLPSVTTLPAEPLRPLASAVSRIAADGRAGWLLETSFPDAYGDSYGDAPANRLWNGGRGGEESEDGEDGDDGIAVRNAATSRFLDRDRLRENGVATPLTSLRALSAARQRHRPGHRQQHRPPVAVPLDVHAPDRRWRLAARHADLVLLDIEHPAAARVARTALKRQAAEAGRNPDAVRVLVRLGIDLTDGRGADLPSPAETMRYTGTPAELDELLAGWHAAGVADGFHLLPVRAATDLLAVVHGLVPRLRGRGLLRTVYRGRTLRDHLGLAG